MLRFMRVNRDSRETPFLTRQLSERHLTEAVMKNFAVNFFFLSIHDPLLVGLGGEMAWDLPPIPMSAASTP